MNMLDKAIMSQYHIYAISTFIDKLGDHMFDYRFSSYIRNDNYFEYFMYAFMNGYNTSTILINHAAGSDKLEMLQYLHENGSPWDETTCCIAIRSDQIKCLQYILTNGCSSDRDACIKAIELGKIEFLQYAHENGCPWDDSTLYDALSIQYYPPRYYPHKMKCIMYAIENGCPYDANKLLKLAIRDNDIELVMYLIKNNCYLVYDNPDMPFIGKLAIKIVELEARIDKLTK